MVKLLHFLSQAAGKPVCFFNKFTEPSKAVYNLSTTVLSARQIVNLASQII